MRGNHETRERHEKSGYDGVIGAPGAVVQTGAGVAGAVAGFWGLP
jgi:hypothetical protein